MDRAAQMFGQKPDPVRKGPVLTNWEASDSHSACVTGVGPAPYVNSDCAPKATTHALHHPHTVIEIVTGATAGTLLEGYFTFHFLGHKVSLQANTQSPSFGANECKAVMETLPNIKTVTCTVTLNDSSSGASTYTITITAWPTYPMENQFFSHLGVPSLDQMACTIEDITQGISPTCSVSVQTAGTMEYAPCSNRGICNFVDGTCRCFDYFYGTACELEGSLDNDVHDRTALAISSTASNYNGVLMEGHVDKASALDFNFIDAKAAGKSVFRVDGFSHMYMGGLSLSGSVETTVSDGGAKIARSGYDADVFQISASHAGFSHDILELSTNTASSTAFNFVKYIVDDPPVDALVIDGTGQVIISSTRAATSTSTGTVVSAGGLGVAGALYARGAIVGELTTESTNKTTGAVINPGGLGIGKRLTPHKLDVESADQLDSDSGVLKLKSKNASYWLNTGGTVLQIAMVMKESSVFPKHSDADLIKASIGLGGTIATKFSVNGAGYVTTNGGFSTSGCGRIAAPPGLIVTAGGRNSRHCKYRCGQLLALKY